MKKIFFCSFFLLLTINQAFALAGNCSGLGLASFNQNLKTIVNTADQLVCFNTREVYQCEKMEADLEGEDKKKVIQCDKNSLANNNLSDTSITSCVWNGFKFSGESLVNFTKLPGAIVELAMKGFKEAQDCNKSLDKKREILNAFNMSISDKRFKLEESFLGRSFIDMPCSELEKLAHSRYDNYTSQVMREMMGAKNTGKNYKMPEELMAKNSDILKTLDNVFKEAGITYNCYSPKAKAEMICAGVTSLLADAALGVGVFNAVKAIKSLARSKKILSQTKGEVIIAEKLPAAQEFAPWSLEKLPDVKVEQILPPEFISSIERKLGSVNLEVVDYTNRVTKPTGFVDKFLGHPNGFKASVIQKKYGGEVIEFNVKSGEETFSTWSFVFDKKNPGIVKIENLHLENPIAEIGPKLHLSQTSKGLPPEVFKYSKDKILKLLKAGGATEVNATSMNYTVSYLYRRAVGLMPANPESEKVFAYLDKLFLFSKKKLPEGLRTKSMDDFSRLLGDVNSQVNKRAKEVETVWKNRKNGISADYELVIDDSSGKTIGIIDNRKEHLKAQVFFIDPAENSNGLLNWADYSEKLKLKLKL